MSTYYDLSIKNYQIISKANIQFKPGLTLITGKSNNGKSSLFKAFKQLVYNTSGTNFIKHNTTQSTITLSELLMDSNQPVYTIKYSKTQDGGKVTIKTPTDSQDFTKLGSSQLPQVYETTHINKEFNYNFWDQLTKPFLISLSPKEQFQLIQESPTSQHLNNALQALTQDRKSLSQSQLQLQSKLELLQQQNQQFTTQLQKLPTIEALHTTLNNLKPKFEELNTTKLTLLKFNDINIDSIKSKLNNLQSLPNLTHIENTITTLKDITQVYNKLLLTTKPINDTQYHINLTQELISKTTTLQEQFTICPLCNQPFNSHNPLGGHNEA